MGIFKYNGVDGAGNSTAGTIEADGLQVAIARLKEKGLFLSEIQELRKKKKGREISAKGKSQGLSMNIGTPSIKPKLLSSVTRQLATLIGSGLPLLRALRVVGEQQKGPISQIFSQIGEDVEGGALFSQALAKHPRSFPKVYVAMVKAGEAGGSLDAVLNRLAEFSESELKLKGKIKSALAYPIIVIVVAGGIVTFVMLKIVPVFTAMFKDFEAGELPAPTRLLMIISDIVVHKIYLVVIGIIALIIFYHILRKIPKTRFYLDLLKIRIFLFGPVIFKTIISRFARTLATLITSGVPILQSLDIVKDTIGNDVVAKGIGDVHDDVREGEGISGPMVKAKVFPPMVTNMVAVGEETGALDQMLEKVADAYESEVDTAVTALTSMLEPILIVFMGAGVAFIVISLFMPLITLSMSMAGG